MKTNSKNTTLLVLILVLVITVICSCGQAEQHTNRGPVIEFTEEDLSLIDSLGDDLNVIEPEDFKEAVSALSTEDSGEVFQFVGYYQNSDDADMLCSKDGKTSITLNLLYTELTVGDCYSVIGVINYHAQGEESHLLFDVVAVESYAAS